MPYFSEKNRIKFEEQMGQPDENGCIPWLGAKTKDGYGLVNIGRNNRCAHRYVLEMSIGEQAPDHLDASHLCHNRSCVNTHHLVFETHADNMSRSPNTYKKGYSKNIGHPPQGCFRPGYPRKKRRWCLSPKRKFSLEEITNIRNSSEKQRILAAKYKVSQTTISRIKNNLIYQF